MRDRDGITTYTCVGSVRGSCEHTHASLRTAMRCLEADQRRCHALPGGTSCSSRTGWTFYADRRIYARDHEQRNSGSILLLDRRVYGARELTADERDEAEMHETVRRLHRPSGGKPAIGPGRLGLHNVVLEGSPSLRVVEVRVRSLNALRVPRKAVSP